MEEKRKKQLRYETFQNGGLENGIGKVLHWVTGLIKKDKS